MERLLQDRLTHTIAERCKTAIVLLVIICIFLFWNLYHLKKGRKNGISILQLLPFEGNTKNRLSIKEQIGFKITAIILLVCFVVWNIIPAYYDCSNQQFVQVSTSYCRMQSDKNLFSNGTVYIYVDGERIALDLPADWDKEEFPEGEYSGIVWYSKFTKIILAFIPDNIALLQ